MAHLCTFSWQCRHTSLPRTGFRPDRSAAGRPRLRPMDAVRQAIHPLEAAQEDRRPGLFTSRRSGWWQSLR